MVPLYYYCHHSQDLSHYDATYWKAGSSALIFVGDISLEKATALSKESFGSWQAGEAPSVYHRPAPTHAPPQISMRSLSPTPSGVVAQPLASALISEKTKVTPTVFSRSLSSVKP